MLFNRRLPRAASFVVGVATLATVGGSLAALPASATTADTTAPTIVSARVQPASVDLTPGPQQVAVTVHAQDDTGIGTIAATLVGPGGSTPITQSFDVANYDAVFNAGTPTDGWWTVQVDVPQTTTVGAWHLDSLTVTDSSTAANATTDNLAVLGALPSPPSSLNVSITRTEHTVSDGLSITNVVATPSAVDTTNSDQTVQVSLHVTDTVDGLNAGTVTLTDAANPSSTVSREFSGANPASGTLHDGDYVVSFPFPEAAAANVAGTQWDISVQASDRYGIQTTWGGSAHITQSAQADTHPPVLDSVSVSPASVTTSTSSATVTATITMHDSPDSGSTLSSGFAGGIVYLQGPNPGDQLDIPLDRTDITPGDATAGTVTASAQLPVRSTAGSWTVSCVSLNDGYNNESFYADATDTVCGPTPTALPTPGASDNRDVSVTTTPETSDPTLDSFQIAPTSRNFHYLDSNGGEPFTGTAHITAHDSGFWAADLQMTAPDGVTSFTVSSAISFENLVPGSGDNTSGTYAFSFDPRNYYQNAYFDANGTDAPAGSEFGTYTITGIVLHDNQDALNSYAGTPVPSLSGMTTSITAADTLDSVAPDASAVTLPSTALQLGMGVNETHIAVSAQDLAGTGEVPSGIQDIQVNVANGSGQVESGNAYWADGNQTAGNDISGTWNVPIDFQTDEGGQWHVTEIDVTDNAGLTHTYTDLSTLAPGSFEVDPPADQTGPTLTALTFSPSSVNSTAGDVTEHVSITATDPSGYDYGEVRLVSPGGNSYLNGFAFNFGPGSGCASNTCTATIDVPQYAQSGDWTVQNVALYDGLNNQSQYSNAQLVALGGSVQSTLNITAAADSTAPVVQSIDFDPATTVDAPLDTTGGAKTVVANVHITDSQSGMQDGWVDLTLGADQFPGYFNLVAGNANDGVWQAAISVPQYLTSGDYKVSASVVDVYGNHDTVTALNTPDYWIHGVTDTTPPVLGQISLPTTTIDSSGAAQVANVDLTITDNASGFASGDMELTQGDGTTHVFAGFDTSNLVGGTTDVYRVAVPVPQYAHSGTWTITSVDIWDAASQQATYSTSALNSIGGSTFQVNALADPNPPVLHSLSITPTTVNVGATSTSVAATVNVTDAESGFDHGRIILTGPDGIQQSTDGYIDGSSPDSPNTYSAAIDVPQNAQPGQWLVSVQLYDAYGNVANIGNGQLPVGATSSVTVNTSYDGTISGTVTDATTHNPVSGAWVFACTTGWGCAASQQTAANGSYSLQHLPDAYYYVEVSPAGTYDSKRVAVDGGLNSLYTDVNHAATVDVALTAPTPPPAGVTVPSEHGTSSNGVPTQYWEAPFTVTIANQCTGATGTVDVAFEDGGADATGPLTESPAGSGSYTATLAAFAPHHGGATVTLHLTCPDTSTVNVPFSIYIDPSGTVVDAQGHAIPNATVTLLRSDTQNGSYTAVPDGSAIMDPANRHNPDATDSSGHFGWDVVAGWYKVQASKTDCYAPNHPETKTVTTGAMQIPPPVTNLQLTLDCTNLAPVASFTQSKSGTVTAGTSVHFDASASSDPNGSITAYNWSFGDGTTGTGATVDHVYSTAGTFTPRLTVIDDGGPNQPTLSTSRDGTALTVPAPVVPGNPTVTVTSAPPALTNQTSGSVGFTTAVDSAVTLSSVTCAVDGGAAAACTSPFSFSGLIAGAHRVVITASDSAGHQGSATAQWTTDTTTPTASMLKPASTTTLAKSFGVSWGGADANGVASYDVRYTRAAWNGKFGAATAWKSGSGTSATFTGVPGYEYCFTVRSRDNAGNVSGPSVAKCTAIPLDDRSLAASAGWKKLTGRPFYLGTAMQTTAKGKTLTRKGAIKGRSVLIVDEGKGFGSVVVLYNGKAVKTVSLAATRTKYHVTITLPRVTRATTIVIKTTSAKKVQIDGLLLARI